MASQAESILLLVLYWNGIRHYHTFSTQLLLLSLDIYESLNTEKEKRSPDNNHQIGIYFSQQCLYQAHSVVYIRHFQPMKTILFWIKSRGYFLQAKYFSFILCRKYGRDNEDDTKITSETPMIILKIYDEEIKSLLAYWYLPLSSHACIPLPGTWPFSQTLSRWEKASLDMVSL